MSFADNFWGGKPKSGAQILFERCEEGRETCNELINFVQQRILIEKEYAKQLDTLVKKTPIGAKEFGTLANGVFSIPKEVTDTAKAHMEFAQRLHNDIVTPFGVFLKTNEQMTKMCTQDALKLHSEVGGLRAKVIKSKEKYDNKCREMDLAEMEIDKAALLKKSNSDVAKMRKKLDKQKKELDALEREFSGGCDRLKDQLGHHVQGMRKVFGDVQKLEEARIQYIKGAINKFMVSCQFRMSKIDETCQAIYAVEQAINPQSDIATFVERKRTGTEPPKEPDVRFVKHVPYSERNTAAAGQHRPPPEAEYGYGGGAPPSTDSSFNSSGMGGGGYQDFTAPPSGGGFGGPPPPPDFGGGGGFGGPPAPPAPDFGGGGGFGGPPAPAGDFGGFGGPPADLGAPPPPPPAGGGSTFVTAVYDYAAQGEGEISFAAGDQIELVAENADGWWEGIFNGARGYFPGNYVQQ